MRETVNTLRLYFGLSATCAMFIGIRALSLREFLPHQHLASYTKRYQVKRRLAKIDANRNYMHIDDPPC